MANMHLVTGYAGQEHVTAADHGAFHSYLFGSGQFVFNRGNKLAASVESNNQIRVLDGDIYIHGRHVRLNEGTYVDLAVDNGEQGMLRNDLIVARYTKNNMTAVEEVNLVVIKGTPASGNPSDPAYTDGNILGGGILHDMPLYRVPLNGLNVGELVPLFTIQESIPVLFENADAYARTKQEQHLNKTITLSAASWVDNVQTVSVAGVTANNTVIVAPSPESSDAYSLASAKCTAQGAGTLTFSCAKVPASNIDVNLVILGV